MTHIEITISATQEKAMELLKDFQIIKDKHDKVCWRFTIILDD